MERFQIYLAGAMSGLSYNEQHQWREIVKEYLESMDCDYKVKCINPVEYYNYFDKNEYDSEVEVKRFDLHKVRTSDLVIVNFNAANSIGTAKELTVASIERIPVIGLNEKNLMLHPWDVDDTDKIFTDMKKMLEYVAEYYLS